MHGRRVSRLFLLLVVLATMVFTLGVMVSVPPLVGPDESAHLGYAAFLFCERRLPHPMTDDIGFQHPPLYHAFLAAALTVMPAEALDAWIGRSGRSELDLPYEKRVALDLESTNVDLCHAYLPDRESPSPGSTAHQIRQVLVVIWRTTGLPIMLLTAALLLFGMRSLGSGDGALATLAAGTAILVPGFGITFATLNNDQFAVLFSTACIAVVLSGVKSGPASMRHLIVAGILGGCALLSKLTALGPLAGCAVWIFFAGSGWKERAKGLVVLVLPAVAAIVWWLTRIFLLTGQLDIVRMTGERWPHLFRDVAPDLSGYADVLATVATTWLGNIGYDSIGPSQVLVLAGLMIPAITIGGSLIALLSRGTSRAARVASGAFLLALVVQTAALLLNNRHSFHTHGRYFQPLTLLGAAALFFGARELFGIRARIVLAAAVTLLAVTGIDLLHARLLPSYYPPRDRFASPDYVAYVDAGLPTHARYVEQGTPVRQPAWGPKPEGSILTHPQEVKLRVAHLDPRGTYVAWIRLHAPARTFSIEDFLADGMPLGGPHSPAGVSGWRRFPIPRRATSDGCVTISAHALLGLASIAELLVTRLPVEVAGVSEKDGRFVVSLRSPAPARLPPLHAVLRSKDGALSEPERVVFGSGGAADVAFGSARAPAQLLLFEPEGVWLDIKLNAFATEIVERGGAFSSPGIDVSRIPGSTLPDAVLFKIPGASVPPGDYRIEVLDEAGRAVPAGRLALVFPDGRRVDAALSRVSVKSGTDKAIPSEIRYAAGGPFTVDRLRLHHAEPHVFDLEPN